MLDLHSHVTMTMQQQGRVVSYAAVRHRPSYDRNGQLVSISMRTRPQPFALHKQPCWDASRPRNPKWSATPSLPMLAIFTATPLGITVSMEMIPVLGRRRTA